MTEEEAKQKWCPFVRNVDSDNTIYTNRDPRVADEYNHNCLGSACMAWRKHVKIGEGYCGLAGKL